MTNQLQQTLDYADSVGFLVDRCLESNDIIGSGFLLAEGKFVTLATLVLPFGVGLEGLKVVFPRTKKECGVESAFFHPHFNRRFSHVTAERAIIKAPDLTLKKHNCVILTLAENLKPISAELVAKINDAYSTGRTSWDKGLSGSLQDIELALVVQTISSAKKTGQLVVSDQRNRPVAKLFFNEGKIFHAQFRHLRKDHAINQMIASKINGFFEFRPSKELDWPALSPNARPTDLVLLEAYRRVDELEKLRAAVGGPDAYLARSKGFLNKNTLPEELHERAGNVWRLLDGLTPNGRLWELVRLDEYDVYKILVALAQEGQIKRITSEGNAYPSNMEATVRLISHLRPVPVSSAAGIDSNTDITCVTLNPKNSFVNPRDGTTVGTIDDTDSWHLIHNAAVLYENIGSPIFRDGQVIGMHCGVLPASRRLESSLGLLQQMLWHGSLMDCLARSKVEAQSQSFVRLAAASLQSSEDVVDHQQLRSIAASEEVAGGAHVAVPAEHHTSVRSLVDGRKPRQKAPVAICSNCGARKASRDEKCPQCGGGPSKGPRVNGALAGRLAAVSLASVLLLALAAAIFWFNLPQPIFAKTDCVVVPESPWLEIAIKQWDSDRKEWSVQPAGKLFHKNELISFEISVMKDCYVYLLYRGSRGDEAGLAYPNNLQAEMIKKRGTTFCYPEAEMQHTEKGMLMTGTSFDGPPGNETIVAVASAKPLLLGNQPRDIQRIFDRGENLLSASEPNLGAEIAKDQLFGAPDDQSKTSNNSAAQGTVYISRFVARHD
jgi:hypothetical protein